MDDGARRHLVTATVSRLRAAGFDHHADRLARVFPTAPATASALPVVRHLDRALELTPNRDIARALATLAPTIPWTQTEAYVQRPPNDDFLARYAHATLFRPPDGTASSTDGVALGVLLLGPGADYPSHEHPADEVYLPLTEASWTHTSDQELRPEPADALIHHEPWQPHGMRTDTEPLLAVYVWTGDVTTASRFSTG